MFLSGLGKASLIAFLVFVLAPGAMADSHVVVSFDRVPLQGAGDDSRGDISGSVSGLEKPGQYKIVIYAHAHRWWVQPTADKPLTDIGVDGKWSNWTHLGNRYAALVVKPGYQPPNNPQSLPEVGGDVIAVVEKKAKVLR